MTDIATNGYQAIREQTSQLIALLRDAALLVGNPQPQPVTLETGGECLAGLGMESDAALLRRRARDLHEGIFKVIVYGEFKHGKSTLLNALLGEKLLPAKTLKCTAIISMLVYGEQPNVLVYRTDHERPQVLDRAAFQQQFQLRAEDEETLDTQGYIDRFKDVAYAQIACTSPLCANGVRLLDSPGLGDHPSRTRVTTRHMRESQAMVLVLNAMRLLGEEEKQFIQDELTPARVGNVFFVVNRINQINPREVGEVQRYFRDFLAPYFTRPDGTLDDERYSRRVFFVNALGALNARLADNTAALDASGVPALETALEHFLTSEQKNHAALDEATRALDSVIGDALTTIEQQRALLGVPLAAFERTISAADAHIAQLVQREQEIDRTIRRFGEVIAHKISASLRDYLVTLRDTWQQDAHELRLDDISMGTILTALVQGTVDRETAQRKIGEPIKREVERFLRRKLSTWATQQVPPLIQPDIDMLVREVEAQVTEFKLELERTLELIAPGVLPDPERERARFVAWTETLINTTLREVLGGDDSPDLFGNWGALVWRVVQQLLLLYVAVAFIGPIGWAVFAVAQVAQIFWTQQQFKQRLLKKIGEELYDRLQHDIPQIQEDLFRDVTQQFARLGAALTTSLRDQIDEKRSELARIHEQKRDASFSATREEQRLATLRTRLAALRAQARAR